MYTCLLPHSLQVAIYPIDEGWKEVGEVTTGVFLQVVHPDSRRVALAATYPIDRPLVAEELVRTLRSLSNGSVALLASYVSADKKNSRQVTMHTSYQCVLSIFHICIH